VQFFERHRDYRRHHGRLPEWLERRVGSRAGATAGLGQRLSLALAAAAGPPEKLS
jgi:hypothetical protein